MVCRSGRATSGATVAAARALLARGTGPGLVVRRVIRAIARLRRRRKIADRPCRGSEQRRRSLLHGLLEFLRGSRRAARMPRLPRRAPPFTLCPPALFLDLPFGLAH